MKRVALVLAVLAAWPAAASGATLDTVDVATGKRAVVARAKEGWTSARWTADGRALIAVAPGGHGLVVRRYPLDGGRPRTLRGLGRDAPASRSPGRRRGSGSPALPAGA